MRSTAISAHRVRLLASESNEKQGRLKTQDDEIATEPEHERPTRRLELRIDASGCSGLFDGATAGR